MKVLLFIYTSVVLGVISKSEEQRVIEFIHQKFSETFPVLHQEQLQNPLKSISDDLKNDIKNKFVPEIIGCLKQQKVVCLEAAAARVEIMVVRNAVGFATDKMYRKCLEYNQGLSLKKVSPEQAQAVVTSIMNNVIFDFYQNPPVFSLEKALINADIFVKNELKKNLCRQWDKCRQEIYAIKARL